jgi:glycosyltransferase involved in cell wall biosynthesis
MANSSGDFIPNPIIETVSTLLDADTSVGADTTGESQHQQSISETNTMPPAASVVEPQVLDEGPYICLNMIVKNESRIIVRLFDSVLPLIDSYCICDTGSADNTVEIIEEYFKSRNIPGKIVREPFRDFAYNRTFALKACEGLPRADFLLLMDADMILRVEPKLCPRNFRRALGTNNCIAYHLFQGSDAFYYKNVRIIKNIAGFSYWGVTHEFLQTPPDTVIKQLDKSLLFVDDIGDGGAKGDKFQRDIRLLSQGLEENPGNDRYTFYLANSYFNTGQHEKAIEYYKQRIEMGGWNQEIWFSYYSIGKSYNALGDFAQALHYWLCGYQCLPCRVENLYQIIHYYRNKGDNVLAQAFYEMARESMDHDGGGSVRSEFLFLENDIYEYKLDYEFTIVGFYRNPRKHDVIALCMKVLTTPLTPHDIGRNVISNYKYYAPSLKRLEDAATLARWEQRLQVLRSVGKTVSSTVLDPSVYVSSTPSVWVDPLNKSKLYVNVRYVSYNIDDNGKYSIRDSKGRNTNQNALATINVGGGQWNKTNETVLEYNKCYDDTYAGLEDVRLFSNNEVICFNATRVLEYGRSYIEHGTIKYGAVASNLVTVDNKQGVEKNWVLFKNGDRQVKTIYGWSPLTIGSIVDDPDRNLDEKGNILKKLVLERSYDAPNFFRWVRGSTNGIRIDDEVWFICHVVSYEQPRCYYHLFVTIDLFSMQLKRYTRLFRFEDKKVEYTLGFVYMEKDKEFLIGYSLVDRETKYMVVSKEKVDKLFVG